MLDLNILYCNYIMPVLVTLLTKIEVSKLITEVVNCISSLAGSSTCINTIIERIRMSYPGFPSIFYSKDALATRTLLLTNEKGSDVNLKINWNTCVIDPEEENIEKVKQNYLAPYNDNDEGLLDCLDIEDNYEILPTKSGKFITTFHVPSVLIPVIVGPKGSKLKQLQEITQTMIKVPRIHEIGVPVKITGHSERSVASARNQVTLLTLSKREKLPSTHFISIPVNSDEVKANFEKFKMEILNDQATRGIDEKIFQNSEKLHLTVEVLRLLDEFEIESAKQLLSENVKEFLGVILQKPYYKIKLKGVEIMNDDPSEVDVLYAKVEMEDNDDLTNFQEIVNQISDLFHMNEDVHHYKLSYECSDESQSEQFQQSHCINPHNTTTNVSIHYVRNPSKNSHGSSGLARRHTARHKMRSHVSSHRYYSFTL